MGPRRTTSKLFKLFLKTTEIWFEQQRLRFPRRCHFHFYDSCIQASVLRGLAISENCNMSGAATCLCLCGCRPPKPKGCLPFYARTRHTANVIKYSKAVIFLLATASEVIFILDPIGTHVHIFILSNISFILFEERKGPTAAVDYR